MNMENSANAELYYTKDHEWINFQGPVAYVGICSFKLLGFKKIQQIIINEPLGFKTRGEVIASIRYNDYQVEAHMPVEGKVVHVNEKLLTGEENVLLQHPETGGWIALIIPSQPIDRTGLLLPEQYRFHCKPKYADQ